jgi:uncharacterized membrane protein YkoI
MQDCTRIRWLAAALPSRRWLVALLLTLAFSAPTRANDDTHEEESDHDKALHAVEHGEILPLEQVLVGIRPQIQGDIIGLELEKEDGLWVYEFKVIDSNGRLKTIYVDAKTAKILPAEKD